MSVFFSYIVCYGLSLNYSTRAIAAATPTATMEYFGRLFFYRVFFGAPPMAKQTSSPDFAPGCCCGSIAVLPSMYLFWTGHSSFAKHIGTRPHNNRIRHTATIGSRRWSVSVRSRTVSEPSQQSNKRNNIQSETKNTHAEKKTSRASRISYKNEPMVRG
jgi:hypothetical protein